MPASPAARAFIEQVRALVPDLVEANELAASITPAMHAASRQQVAADLRDWIAQQVSKLLTERNDTSEMCSPGSRLVLDGSATDAVRLIVKNAVNDALARALLALERRYRAAPGTGGSNVMTLLTVEQVADRLAISKRSVLRSAIPVVRIGRSRRYRPEDVQTFAQKQRQRPVAADAVTVARRLASGRRSRPG